MLHEIPLYVGGGLAVVLIYVLVSNTLWLLFGSRLLQCLPGVKIKGLAGTFKIAAMLVLSVVGVAVWCLKFIPLSLMRDKTKPTLKNEIGKMIQRGARLVERLRRRAARSH